MRELDYLTAVYTIASDAAVRVHHCCVSWRCEGENGFPDLVLVGIHGVLFREIKASYSDRPSPEQTAWLWLLKAAGADADVWNSEDLLCGRVADEIAKIA